MMPPMQQPMMPPGMMPPMQQPMAPGMPQHAGMDGFAILDQMATAEVKEKILWGEVLTQFVGVEVDFANKYAVLDAQGQEVFFFAEQTDFCKRQMKRGCCADCVGWDVDVLTTYAGQKTKFMQMKRESTATCCCFNRPLTDISDYNGVKIGSIRDPWACCDLTFQLNGPDGEEAMQVRGGCCQCGMICPLPCGPCAEVHFTIVDSKTQDEVGHITKKVPSCFKFLVDSEVDNYKIDFAKVTVPQWKAIVLALSVFIDFRYFSETQDPNQIGNDGLIGIGNHSGGDGGFGGGDGIEF